MEFNYLILNNPTDICVHRKFGNPVEVNTQNGILMVYPQRTNNILEQFFRGIRRGQRRKTGNDSMSRTLQTMLTDTPLVKNLDNPEYMELLLNGKTDLEELFAEIGSMPSKNNSGTQPDTHRMLPGFRTFISLPGFPAQVVRLFNKPKKVGKSN